MTGWVRRSRCRLDGVLLLDKPMGMSSQAAVTRARLLLGGTKAGHTGTLDPMAGGLLPVCVGEATKFSRFLLNADKTYLATVRLGVTTDTGDLEGRVTASATVAIDPTGVAAVLGRFTGDILQTPPMHSAIKFAGKPLYKYARAGVAVERKPRRVRIHSIECRGYGGAELHLTVSCGKGTYIRVLAEEIGNAFGCGGCLAALVRTTVGEFNLDAAVSLEELEGMALAERKCRLLPVDSLVTVLCRVDLDTQQTRHILTGRTLHGLGTTPKESMLRLYGPGEEYLGVAMSDSSGTIVPRRLMSTGAVSCGLTENSHALHKGETMLEKTSS